MLKPTWYYWTKMRDCTVNSRVDERGLRSWLIPAASIGQRVTSGCSKNRAEIRGIVQRPQKPSTASRTMLSKFGRNGTLPSLIGLPNLEDCSGNSSCQLFLENVPGSMWTITRLPTPRFEVQVASIPLYASRGVFNWSKRGRVG